MNMLLPQPGPPHAWLARHAGDWDAAISTTIAPGAPSLEWAGEMNIRMTGGGLWQVMDFRGDMAGRPFTGHGVAGFDMMQQKYVHCCVDSMNPIGAVYEGSYDAATNTMTTYASAPDPMRNNKVVYYKNVFQYHGNDAGTMTLSEIDLGVENKMLQIDYTRRK